jgi:hypothetical protein
MSDGCVSRSLSESSQWINAYFSHQVINQRISRSFNGSVSQRVSNSVTTTVSQLINWVIGGSVTLWTSCVGHSVSWCVTTCMIWCNFNPPGLALSNNTMSGNRDYMNIHTVNLQRSEWNGDRLHVCTCLWLVNFKAPMNRADIDNS